MILVRITFENELESPVAINVYQVDHLPRRSRRHVSICALEWHGAYNTDFRSRPDQQDDFAD
jgi:hypothetical protein